MDAQSQHDLRLQGDYLAKHVAGRRSVAQWTVSCSLIDSPNLERIVTDRNVYESGLIKNVIYIDITHHQYNNLRPLGDHLIN